MRTLNFVFKILLLTLALQNAIAGVSSGGGGDQYTADFINVATLQVHPWLVKNGHKVSPAIDATKFLTEIEEITKRIESKDIVYESCNETNDGRIVAACFNAETDMIYLNRKLYPIDLKNSPAKRLLVMHEIFRRMKLEGDKYEITRKLNVILVNPELTLNCIIGYYRDAGFKSGQEKTLAIQACEKNSAEPSIQKCVTNLHQKANFVASAEKWLAVDACERSAGDINFQNYVVDLFTKADFKTYAEKISAIESYFRQKD